MFFRSPRTVSPRTRGRHSLATPMCALALLAGAPLLPAQDDPAAAPDSLVSVEFAGGSLVDYIKDVRAAGDNVNIVYPETASQVPVPRISLRQVSVEAALKVLSDVLEDGYAVQTTRVRTGDHPAFAGEPVFTVRVQIAPGAGANQSGGSQRPQQAVFSLRVLTQGMPDDPAESIYTPETVLSAIETALLVGRDQTDAVLRLHAESGLLFVVGSGREIGTVGEVLRMMEQDVVRTRDEHRVARSRQARVQGGGDAGKEAR